MIFSLSLSLEKSKHAYFFRSHARPWRRLPTKRQQQQRHVLHFVSQMSECMFPTKILL